MNLCLTYGKVVSDVKYNFLYDYKYNIAIAFLKLELNNKIQIEIYAFDEMADRIYAEAKAGDYLFVESKIRTSGRLEVIWFEKI